MDISVIFLILSGLLLLAYIIVNVVFAFYFSFKYNFENKRILDEIEENLNGALIYSFRISHYCELYEKKLVIDKFKGIKICNCQGTKFIRRCTEQEIIDECKDIFLIEPKEYTKINSQYICVTKSSKTYLNLLKDNNIISKDKGCPNNYKLCGTIDTLDNQLCVKNEENCPLTSNEIHNLSLLNDDNNEILSIFKLDQKYPCMNSNHKNWNFNGDLQVYADECSNKIRNELYDFRYKKINITTNQYDLYKENDLLDDMEQFEINTDKLKNEKVNFFGRTFLGFDREKAINYNREVLMSKQNLLNNCLYAMEIVAYIVVAPLFYLCCVGCAGIKYGAAICICILVTLAILFIPSSIIYFILSIIIFVNHNAVESLLDFGSDKYTNALIKELMEGSSVNFCISLFSIIVFPIIIISISISLCILYNKKEK